MRTSTSLACVALGITCGLALAAAGPSLARFTAGLIGRGGRASAPHAAPLAATAQATWLATWAASPQAAGVGAVPRGGLDDRTVRDVIYTSVGGTAIRVRISNLYGTVALHIGAASVGTILDGAGLLPGGTRALAFGQRGERSVTIPAGGSVTSDPVSYNVPPLTELAVSLYLPVPTGLMTVHSLAQQDSYVAD